MLFNSYEFLFGFLPIVLLVYFALTRLGHAYATAWLGVASLFFYGWWSLAALPLLVASICLNYWCGRLAAGEGAASGLAVRRTALVFGIVGNLLVLGFFKYANFFLESANHFLQGSGHAALPLLQVALPIGISFFTFTQIAFLVDCHQGKVRERKFLHYLLFVSYFPHLIAGPVLHHAQMMPQFADRRIYHPDSASIALGVLVFAIGLSKKLLLADPLSEYADALFNGVAAGQVVPMFFMAWSGVLAYTFQIYFDFSGYSDMAIGLSLLFGVRLPINFNAPYRATSIIDFWRRWHISLSVFLRDYLYIPLGGNRLGRPRRYLNLFVTMLLGGLWHGANWTFVLWGGMHGLLLVANHLWRATRWAAIGRGRAGAAAAWLVTMLSVAAAWVLFRAESVSVAAAVYRGMLGLNGFSLPQGLEPMAGPVLQFLGHVEYMGLFQGAAMSSLHAGLLTAFSLAVVFLPRSSSDLYLQPPRSLPPRLRVAVSLAAGVAVGTCLSLLGGGNSPFLYFQF